MQISKRNFIKSASVGFVGLFLGINILGNTEALIETEKNKIKSFRKEVNMSKVRIKNIPNITIRDYKRGETIEYQELRYKSCQ